MTAGFGGKASAIAMLIALAACGNPDKAPELMNLRSQTAGPDEFAILPTKPLQMPEDLASLPEPTPGGGNLTDPTPEADAVAALGGNPGALTRTGIGAGDAALIAQATRFGTSATIRQDLAAADLEYRRANDGRLLERVFNVNVYFRAYKPLSLDQYAELAFWRARGIRTVGAPPKPTE